MSNVHILKTKYREIYNFIKGDNVLHLLFMPLGWLASVEPAEKEEVGQHE